MSQKSLFLIVLMLALGALVIVPATAQNDFVFGMVLVGPQNDQGWSQAHFEGGQYVEENVPGARMIVADRINPADSPEYPLDAVVADMVADGARLIFTTSDEFEEDTTKVASQYPDVVFINISGDDAYDGSAPSNVGNVMGEMEWGKMIAGCAAALTTQTGSIGYLGPLINFETRRLAASAYLGARHCYETYAGGNPDDLTFTVTWIGFWFNIPGVTLDPTEESNFFFDNGADVVISGIDTTEALTVAGQRASEGQSVWAVPYDFIGACDKAPDICLGVPYFNWGPLYVEKVNAVIDGTWEQDWEWVAPDWSDINNRETSAVGFISGPGLSEENQALLDAFIAEMAAFATDEMHADTFYLWEGPLNLQDGTPIAGEGEFVPKIAPLGEAPSVWYLEQLLEGMVGASSQ